MGGNDRYGSPTFRNGNMERRVGNLQATGPEHVQLSIEEEVFFERMEEGKGGVNKETGETGKFAQLL